jgi:uridine nucleosidase
MQLQYMVNLPQHCGKNARSLTIIQPVGDSGLDGTTILPKPLESAKTEVSAIEAMYAALKLCAPKSAWLVATGALTNVAVLFLLHPDLVEHVAGLSIMGGAIGGNFTDAKLASTLFGPDGFGNWSPFAEFNIFVSARF